MHGLSLVVASGGYCLVAVHCLLIVVASVVAEDGFQGMWVSAVMGTGLVALWHVESSQTRGRSGSPALMGGLSTTGPPRESSIGFCTH